MTLLMPSVGEAAALGCAFRDTSPEALILKVFSNNHTPIAGDTAAAYTEVGAGLGYTAFTLTRAGFSAPVVATPSYIQYGTPQVINWSGTATVYGYYLVGASSTTIYWAEVLYPGGQVFNNGDSLTITPKISLN
jgi:hypothetical protein